MRTTARRDGSDWILNGSKMWITNGSIADPRDRVGHAEEGIVGFIVPASTQGFYGARRRTSCLLRGHRSPRS